MTECAQSTFEFQAHFSRAVRAQFDGGTMTSDGGGLLLRETDRRLKLLPRLAEGFLDGRDPARVQHSVGEMVAQRVYGLALGYEDLNDHEQLRQDPLLKLLAAQSDLEAPLAGKSTLNRLELSTGTPDRYKKITFWKQALDELLVEVFVEAHATAPEQIVLDIDTTDVALHGDQEGRLFHGYYDHYCYLPLYVFCGEHVLCARLRPANIDASAGSLEEVRRIFEQIRKHWPAVRITLRGDSGFCRDELMSWCENHGVDYVFGFARNPRLRALVADALVQAQQQWEQTRQPARVFVEFSYATTSGSWSRARRVVAKAEHIDGKENPRYGVTSRLGKTGRRRSCTRNSIAPVAIWKTASRNSSSCSPIVPAPSPCAPINCACIFPPWPMCWCPACGVSDSRPPNWLPRRPPPSACGCSRSARWCGSRFARSGSPCPAATPGSDYSLRSIKP
jgi:hypothetical protein